MAGLDSKPLVQAAYQRLDSELRDERRELVRAALFALSVVAAILLVAYVLVPLGPAQRVEGKALRTVQGAADDEHVVYLVIALDNGETVTARPDITVPIGARVTLNRRQNRFGKPSYTFLDLAYASPTPLPAPRGTAP